MAENEGDLWDEHHQMRLAEADWRGTARIDQWTPDTAGSLERVVGLDPSEWTIIAFGLDDVGVALPDPNPDRYRLRIIAVPVSLVSETEDNLLAKIVSPDGEIEATEFLVQDFDPYQFLLRITRNSEISMRRRFIGARPIRVVSFLDLALSDGQGVIIHELPEE